MKWMSASRLNRKPFEFNNFSSFHVKHNNNGQYITHVCFMWFMSQNVTRPHPMKRNLAQAREQTLHYLHLWRKIYHCFIALSHYKYYFSSLFDIIVDWSLMMKLIIGRSFFKNVKNDHDLQWHFFDVPWRQFSFLLFDTRQDCVSDGDDGHHVKLRDLTPIIIATDTYLQWQQVAS